ncbi:MAG TPA: acylphosphatase [Acidimicrobiia bacterium]|nr:acylphosphatase [Acidimicrobiia bacterium]
MTTRVRVVVTGRVQGVFFRDGCCAAARAEGVSGWVRNRGDGAVEAELEGPQAAVERVVAWCRAGPPRAHVETVTVEAIEPVGAAGFRVR